MPGLQPQSFDKTIDEIAALVTESSSNHAEMIERLVRFYYHGVSARDLREATAADRYGAVVAHWRLACQYILGSNAFVRVYNPQLDQDGWHSGHTIVEVVVDDMPFLVDSARMAINRCGLSIHLAVHPILYATHDSAGRLSGVLEGKPQSGNVDSVSFMHFEVDRQTDDAVLTCLRSGVEDALADVRTVVGDVDAMRERVDQLLAELTAAPPPIDPGELSEGCAFLRWLRDGHFIFLGYRNHDLVREQNEDHLRIVSNSALGLLRKSVESEYPDQFCRSFASLSPEARNLARNPELLVITRSGSESTVHRPGYMDYIGV